MNARLFHLVRHTDVTGVSGTGVVAEGTQYSDGAVTLRWLGDKPSTSVWADLDTMLAVHGHDGATVVEWIAWADSLGRPQDVRYWLTAAGRAALEEAGHRVR